MPCHNYLSAIFACLVAPQRVFAKLFLFHWAVNLRVPACGGGRFLCQSLPLSEYMPFFDFQVFNRIFNSSVALLKITIARTLTSRFLLAMLSGVQHLHMPVLLLWHLYRSPQ